MSVSSVRRLAIIKGSVAFLAPEIGMIPLRRFPPTMRIRSMLLLCPKDPRKVYCYGLYERYGQRQNLQDLEPPRLIFHSILGKARMQEVSPPTCLDLHCRGNGWAK